MFEFAKNMHHTAVLKITESMINTFEQRMMLILVDTPYWQDPHQVDQTPNTHSPTRLVCRGECESQRWQIQYRPLRRPTSAKHVGMGTWNEDWWSSQDTSSMIVDWVWKKILQIQRERECVYVLVLHEACLIGCMCRDEVEEQTTPLLHRRILSVLIERC
jgi:hypothetical protein